MYKTKTALEEMFGIALGALLTCGLILFIVESLVFLHNHNVI